MNEYYVAFNEAAECSPFLTQCPRCNNPSNACDQLFVGFDIERMRRALSEDSIAMPSGLTLEEMREFILRGAE